MIPKFPNNTALVLIPFIFLGIIQLVSVSPKLIQLEIGTPLGWVSLNTWTGTLK